MASQQQLSQQELVQAVFAYATELKASGLTKWQVEAKLVERGLSREAAGTVSSKLFDSSQTFASSSRDQMRFTPSASQRRSENSGLTNMVIGGGIALIGLAITIGTYSAAQGGGTYLIMWGPVIFGGLQFLRGLGQFLMGD